MVALILTDIGLSLRFLNICTLYICLSRGAWWPSEHGLIKSSLFPI